MVFAAKLQGCKLFLIHINMNIVAALYIDLDTLATIICCTNRQCLI